MRTLAHVARRYDRNYGHFTTRQNIQFNWIKLTELPDLMADLAAAGLHGMQTSGNCVRNITTDQWAGVALDEIEDPRIWAEILRQHSTMHPEFSFLPRKFKIALTAATRDRAAVRVHDIGLRMHKNSAGETGFEVIVGGGLGRTPFIGKTIKPFLHKRDLLSYIEAILRVFNQYGRRDNIYKARIKILVHDLGAEKFAAEVEEEWKPIKESGLVLEPAFVEDIVSRFRYPAYEKLENDPAELRAARTSNRRFDAWFGNSVAKHKVPGYAIVTLSLKPEGGPPGDATAEQMDSIAELADRYSSGEDPGWARTESRVAACGAARFAGPLGEAGCHRRRHPECRTCVGHYRLPGARLLQSRQYPFDSGRAGADAPFWQPERGARSRPPAHHISGCINACGHHHVGHIGILGVEKNGEEFFQITLGGRADEEAELGALLGPAVPYAEVADVIEDVVAAYVELRERPDELFIDAVKRVGIEPFKERVYATR